MQNQEFLLAGKICTQELYNQYKKIYETYDLDKQPTKIIDKHQNLKNFKNNGNLVNKHFL